MSLCTRCACTSVRGDTGVANHYSDFVVAKEREKQSQRLDARLKAQSVVSAMLYGMHYAALDVANKDHIRRMWRFFFEDQSVLAHSKNLARQVEIEKEANQFREAGEKMNEELERDPLGSEFSMHEKSDLNTKKEVLHKRSKLASFVEVELKRQKLL
eukprot:3535417-Rhodomonas_salina.1